MVRKATPYRVDPPSQPRTTGNDVVLPIVLWTEPPQIEVCIIHVFRLPMTEASDVVHSENDRKEGTWTQLCVFAGTVDGHVLYWRFHDKTVAQVNLLVFPGCNGHSVVGLVNGIDEWGQHVLISATTDGAVAKWQLPNGACTEASACIANELAPLCGLEILGNPRYAVVVSAVSRLMVLDTWKMELICCHDTAQEQIRRSITVGELQMPHFLSLKQNISRSSTIYDTNIGSLDEQKPQVRQLSMNTMATSTVLNEISPEWDAVVLSLGTKGLIKCFLCTQPREASINALQNSVKTFCWVQRSSWVISWADEAADITCSQSTSLKRGDNMDPQTALMSSIKSSYFPLSMHVSADSSLVLLVWSTKFVVLKRKWLCPMAMECPDKSDFVGSCRIPPSEFVRRATNMDNCTDSLSCSADRTEENIFWDDGTFLADQSVSMWTTSGHVFQFPMKSAIEAGKFFIFTKAQDQLVPRSNSRVLHVIDQAIFIESMKRCKCCDLITTTTCSRQHKFKIRRHSAGFLSLKMNESIQNSRLEIVHTCRHGTLGLWTISTDSLSSLRHELSMSKFLVKTCVGSNEPVRVYSFQDGFPAISKKANEDASVEKKVLFHLIIGRNDALSSSIYEVTQRARARRERQQRTDAAMTSVENAARGNLTASTRASNVSVLATALTPVRIKRESSGTDVQSGSVQTEKRNQDCFFETLSYQFLMDIPIVVKGLSNGNVYINLLSHEYSSNSTKKTGTHFACHSGRITALAHCFWGVNSTASQKLKDKTDNTANGTQFPRTTGNDVVLPIVLWTEPPQIEVCIIHVFRLPMTEASDVVHSENDRKEGTWTQLCVFAGTVDGHVLYWRFHDKTVAQVNLLVFPGCNGHSVVGLVNGIDEWGQHVLISATTDGAVAKWQLPNGACTEASACIANELAPLCGLEILGNPRYAVVVSAVSRLMVLDTWKMELICCHDTAQEQIRRSITVGELQMPHFLSLKQNISRSSTIYDTNIGSLDEQKPQVRQLSMNTMATSTVLNEISPEWDAVVLSLGTKGLIKCFLCTQPREASINALQNSVKTFCWVQRSSWVISWADEAADITCSQSTSLKRGDNMDPQTALMSSIKSSYFPLSMHVSADSSLVLLVWSTKFVVLKRKWLCPMAMECPDKSDFVGSCRIPPSEFVRRATNMDNCTDSLSCSADRTEENIFWDDGTFLADQSVSMWTTSGHVFQFPMKSAIEAGKFFIFTKAQDQLVPRSNSRVLHVIDQAIFIESMKRCKCCDLITTTTCSRQHKFKIRRHSAGFLSLKMNESIQNSRLEIVHTCRHGTLGLWTISTDSLSSLRHELSMSKFLVKTCVGSNEPVRVYSFQDGFPAISKKANEDASVEKKVLFHLIIGRNDALSSSIYEVTQRARARRERQQRTDAAMTSVENAARGNLTASTRASNVSVLATALTPVRIKRESSGTDVQSGSVQTEKRNQDCFFETLSYQFLMDIPIVVKGLSNGNVYINLLSHEYSSNSTKKTGTHFACHSGRITALAHCFWGVNSTASQKLKDKTDNTANGTQFVSSHFFNLISEQNRSKQDYSFQNAYNPLNSRLMDTSNLKTPLDSDALMKSQPSIKLFVFSGGSDGVFRVLELTIYRSADGRIQYQAAIMQRFRNHRGAIERIEVSPRKKGCNKEVGGLQDPDRLVATIGIDHKVVIYAPQDSMNRLEWACLLEFAENGDRIGRLEWHFERGLLYIECDDLMVYVWSLDTGILERIIPTALLFDESNASEALKTDTLSCSHVDCSSLIIGGKTVQVMEFAVLSSADRLKQNWTSYYSSLMSKTGVNSIDVTKETFSEYATGSMELFLLSLVLSWGIDDTIDQSCQSILGVTPINALYSCALQEFRSKALTIPVPWATTDLKTCDPTVAPVSPAFARNWQHSTALSASIALGIVSLCLSCMESNHARTVQGPTFSVSREAFQVLWSQLITLHSIVLPESTPLFQEPALNELAAFGFNSCDYTRLAARTLLSGVINRLSTKETSYISAKYSAKLHYELQRLETTSGGNSLHNRIGAMLSSQSVGTCSTSASVLSFSFVIERLGSLVLLLSMVGTYFPGGISPTSAREVCDVLVFLLQAPEQYVASVSAELLTKGLMLFRPHLVDLASLVVQLLLNDMREKQRCDSAFNSDMSLNSLCGSNAAMSLLVEVGAYEAAFVLNVLHQEMHIHDRPLGFHQSILLYMMELVSTHYLLLCRHLPALIDTIMACLEPTKPDRRRRCLPLSTRCLHGLVRRFPMVDFHQETQRLALGTMDAVIVIYDLRTATKWRVLDGHGSAVSAVRFRLDGQVLVSYAARDGSVRWWNSGNAGLFGGMLKMHQSCLKEHKLAALEASDNGRAPSSMGGASAGLKQIIKTCRFQFFTRKNGTESEELKLVLRLTREDASQVQFLL
ncbi:hypothetical protein CCR75_003410 [Bremia lactucae]|uniref:Uncharacterized protein n=1 Tax=Bremia lactucae TaxID=4779 RepID=A0A976IHK6_BRELC|nr:hypothetical protein CCR75_003410 [Bremia lactucae]